MPTPVIPTAYRVTVTGDLFVNTVQNVWYCAGPDPFDPVVAADIAATFQTGYSGILAHLSQDFFVYQIDVQNLAGVASGSYTLFITSPESGAIVQDSLPSNNAFCVRLRTALPGRRFRGRKYFAGLGEGDVTGNTYDIARADGIVSAVQDLIDALATNLTPMQIVSFVGETSVPVTSASYFDRIVDSQRRRLTGRGR
jgi:hypothetical protein